MLGLFQCLICLALWPPGLAGGSDPQVGRHEVHWDPVSLVIRPIYPRSLGSSLGLRVILTDEQPESIGLDEDGPHSDSLLVSLHISYQTHLPILFKRNEGLIAHGQRENCQFYKSDLGGGASALTICDWQRLSGIFRLPDGRSWEIRSKNGGQSPVHEIAALHGLVRPKRDVSLDEGFMLGDLWRTQSQESSEKSSNESALNKRGEIRCQGSYCQYFKVKQDVPKWMEIAVIADKSVVDFHGNDSIRHYVLTLLNVVSAIYTDPTLGSNLKFVLTHLVLFPGTPNASQAHPIQSGQSKASLANVNAWNQAYLERLPAHERPHDVAIWITREDIGGPSGYAPVSGICDPARSCSLIREDGLSSAFIIAHELGHLLGLSHDGDLTVGNECDEEARQGSVMAPLVGATFSYFHWSPCSSEEYHLQSEDWHCLLNTPHPTNVTFIGNSFHHAYSLDEQCRMEFGDGFRFCNSFQLPDPCAQLWCNHKSSPDTCKTKKGPPMDGTECDVGHWCISGFCETTSKRRAHQGDGVHHNPRAGGWSQWGAWEDCSRTCGTGVVFRSRKCDNPRPSYGGDTCRGKPEEFRLCNLDPCPKASDFRAEQCHDLFELITLNTGAQASRSDQTWFPFEHDLAAHKCQLTCYNREDQEYYQTGENVIDGTPCSYDEPSDICIQGECIPLGCDKILGSPLVEDACGFCGGDGSKCGQKRRNLSGGPMKDGDPLTKVMFLPVGSRNIRINITSQNTYLALKEQRENHWISFAHVPASVAPSDNFQVQARGKGGSLLAIKREEFAKSLVTSGTRFEIERGSKSFSARGPLIAPLTLFLGLMNRSRGENYSLTVEYTEAVRRESAGKPMELVVQGWSKCSQECGGGRQTVILRCVDPSTGRRHRKHFCRANAKKASLRRSRTCNNFSCDFTWSSAHWEDCTHSCGVHGTQFRQTFCVPREVNVWDHQIGAAMVDPGHCRGDKPARSRECQRVPCRGGWVQVDWTPCSATCGQGIRKGIFECRSSVEDAIFFDCGPRPVAYRKCQSEVMSECPESAPRCQSPPSHELLRDQSKVCADEVMHRYCVIPAYRQLCCRSCRQIKAEWQE
eukprot:maker-scaffold1543_size36305-snap-gene-0.8 protein:Tk02760 transcript:maker-scaffold1543_size36305-snap-gene-0.8-mRNA-1 annotation:"hypothetical protein D910_03831"